MLGSRRRLGRGGGRAARGGESERRRDVLWWRRLLLNMNIRYLVLRVEGWVGCAYGMIV